MMTSGKVCIYNIHNHVFLSDHTHTPSQQPDKATMWSSAGINIDIDNLLTSPIKTVDTSSAPTMNQLAKGTGSAPSFPPSSSSSGAAGPNYTINTASLMGPGPAMPPRPPTGMGMGGRGMGMGGGGMGMGGGGGMGMGQMGMGYGGYGARPGMMPMYGGGYGMAPQPGMGMGPMGYSGMPPSMGGNQQMGAQQKLM